MAVELNHTIVAARAAEASARWLADALGLAEPEPAGPFWQVNLANGVALDFVSVGDERVVAQHYAFLMTEGEFDQIFRRLLAGSHEIWADPHQQHRGQINHNHGGRGLYFLSNDEHLLEVLTKA